MIPDEWCAVVEAFEALGGDLVERRPDGTWAVGISLSMSSLETLMATAPDGFRDEALHRVPLLDGHGQDIDDESASGVAANREALAIVVWHDHWQAGLSATLTVYADEPAFVEALERAVRQCTEVMDDEVPEEA